VSGFTLASSRGGWFGAAEGEGEGFGAGAGLFCATGAGSGFEVDVGDSVPSQATINPARVTAAPPKRMCRKRSMAKLLSGHVMQGFAAVAAE